MDRFNQKLRPGGAANATNEADARPRGGARLVAVAALAGALAIGVTACGGDDSTASGGGGGSIDMIGYSTPEEAYTGELEPGFTATPDGEGVEF